MTTKPFSQDRMPTLTPAVCRMLVIVSVVAFVVTATPGCRTPPPAAMTVTDTLDRANRNLPLQWDAIQTVVFEIKPRWWWPPVRVTTLGYAAANRATGDYRLVCLSPLGIKMFEVSRINGRESASTPAPEFRDKQDFLDSIRRDASRLVQLDLPKKFRVTDWSSECMTIEDASTATNRTRYVLSMSTSTVVSKLFYEGSRCVAQADYSDYRKVDGTEAPFRVVLHNKKTDYRLSLSVKEFHRQR